ncbi:MAG TPA: exodeoxyribonuclease VII large subunit [Solirubrobacteraceae bacterium]|jgi:exodeoxyribonuclease VII large subunit|nr:exodeoxyribonuclease VII large subunit [Solirubrobacteraceae bacterium]
MGHPEHGASVGIPGSRLPGPFPVGEYAAALRRRLRGFAHVQLSGELSGVRPARARVYFELRDARGAVPCSAWREDWERIQGRCGQPLLDGMEVIVAGGCDYYVGSASASPSFGFHVWNARPAGEGDLLARIERLRRALLAEGLGERQARLRRPVLPRTIGVVTGEAGKARDDVLAALRRRGWAGRLVWAFAPVQDRHAAPAIARALADLVAVGEVEVVVIARGGGSLVDLLAFCEESLCRTVALLPIPVIASVGHHSDRTVLDDVAAVSCSTPTHAAEAAVPLHCDEARSGLGEKARRLRLRSLQTVALRAGTLARQARAPIEHLERERRRLEQSSRELRATARRRGGDERERLARRALVLDRKARAGADDVSRRRALDALALALDAHDPERTLARGYALVQGPDGDLVTSAAAASDHERLDLRFHDGRIPVRRP